jgi:D-3-phosphoglycerate dehydrogenase
VKILVADKFEQSGIDGLRAAGCDVVWKPDLKDASLEEALRDTRADVLVVRGTPVTEPMIAGAALTLIVRAGAGYNTIDVAAASKRGVYVSNCPGKNAIAVAELTFALILSLDRRVPDNVADLRAGVWNKKKYSEARGLFGRTLGLLGYGTIGQEVARRAQAFGMPVVVWSRRFSQGAGGMEEVGGAGGAGGAGVEIAGSPEDVAGRSDILSVHLALTPDTRGLVNASVLDRLRPGAFLINTSRGEVVDAAALARAVGDRGIRAGLDVFTQEPSSATGTFGDPIVQLPNVYGTHHIGGSTDQAQEAIAAEVVRVIVAYKNTGRVPNVVNLATQTPATHTLLVRHRDRPGVLAHVLERLRDDHINVQEMENVVFEGAEAAIARINLDGAPSEQLLKTIHNGVEDILDIQLVQI